MYKEGPIQKAGANKFSSQVRGFVHHLSDGQLKFNNEFDLNLPKSSNSLGNLHNLCQNCQISQSDRTESDDRDNLHNYVRQK